MRPPQVGASFGAQKPAESQHEDAKHPAMGPHTFPGSLPVHSVTPPPVPPDDPDEPTVPAVPDDPPVPVSLVVPVDSVVVAEVEVVAAVPVPVASVVLAAAVVEVDVPDDPVAAVDPWPEEPAVPSVPCPPPSSPEQPPAIKRMETRLGANHERACGWSMARR